MIIFLLSCILLAIIFKGDNAEDILEAWPFIAISLFIVAIINFIF